jgi:glycosyltransferase involved in cell wall biosynthesis
VKKIVFICPYPTGLAPSQRFRYEQYIDQLQQKGFHIVIKPFFTEKTYSAFYQNGGLLTKIHAITESYFIRLSLLFQLRPFDLVFIHREATPAGPPIIEWFIAKILQKKIIYDFDDAIWLTDRTNESSLTGLLRWRSKVGLICKWSYKVSCGNDYLATYARQFNNDVTINPTTVDTTHTHIASIVSTKTDEHITIGWTGSRSTLKYLKNIIPVLQALERKYPHVEYLMISDEDADIRLSNKIFRAWNKETEIMDLSAIDIGLMPLPDDSWTRGKCGFKALQYMAMEIPAVVSPVGVNKAIVENGVEGYCCTSFEEWFNRLEKLIHNPAKRTEMGKRGRQKVIDNYSVASNSSNFLSLFQ